MALTTDRFAASADVLMFDKRMERLPTLPDTLTWSATLDPHDETREIEITDDMVCRALVQMEKEQIYPFRGEEGMAPPVARPSTKADVIPFPTAHAV